MIIKRLIGLSGQGYIAGTGDGIVTVGGVPSARDILVLNADDLTVASRTQSLKTGKYLITGLDPNREYLIMCRDHERQYEPFVWDYVKPMTDKTLDEQLKLWHEWQA